MVFLYLNIKKYHSTKVIFILSLPLFGNVLELISLKWHFQYCKNIIQELGVLLMEYCVVYYHLRLECTLYNALPTRKIKYLHF